jgi:hypothetical protein
MAAQGQMIDLVAFGGRGLWTTARQKLLPPEYCTTAKNLRLATSGALALRKGWSAQTTTPVAGKNMETLHEYVKADESVEVIIAWDGGISNSITDPVTGDVSGAVTDTDGNWFFQNFNDKVIGFQKGQKAVVYSGTTFANIVEGSGTAPTGGVGCAAYGRLWQVDSTGNVIDYCGLLDETDWGSASAGSINMNNIWTDGQDTVQAIRGFNGALVVWGKRHVVFFADAAGASALGLNPANIYVQDIIAGTGCVDQHSVQLVGEKDIVFLSYRGVQSLGRLIQERSTPIETLTAKVEQDLIDSINAVVISSGNVRSVYSPSEGQYILSFPGRGECWALEMRHLYQDEIGGLRAPTFFWELTAHDLIYRQNADMLIGSSTVVGKVEQHLDDTADIAWEYQSPWLDFGEDFANRKKMLKRIGMIIRSAWGGTILVKWAVDFGAFTDNVTITLEDISGGAEWGSGKWNESEFAGTIPLRQIKKSGRKTGQYYKFAISGATNKELTLQQFEIFYKIGRLA